ncbi:NAD(P)/FAD-dependent oxidoreductase [Mechercharimyces sp. CAU 1602]|uniref:NAD(P)/FAD-dependent oxidoreductase n=1 Tax=Mechercharimyces sp. CAU 1602 TaxID=2973933 RepID=UPI0021637310|nr:NAD(P)/FAD-dependent oxidoreductase [Mechercharimyces sp. CAU 1602]MCS1351846.1 NAD(P)/FAD-dependent oxidoreductase [Mechercharimyces sp. CAU 1602]
MKKTSYDVAIIGGGASGMSAALVLGRTGRMIAVIDEGKPRNAVALHSHGYLTQDGVSPHSFRECSRKQLATYPNVHFITMRAEQIEQYYNAFILILSDEQRLQARKVLFATGMIDQLPPLPGLKEAYGKSIFPCPYCDGWEVRDQPLALLGSSPSLYSFAHLIYEWSKDLMVFSHGLAPLPSWQKNILQKRQIILIEEPISHLSSQNGFLEAIILQSGRTISRRAAFLLDTHPHQACLLPYQLGVTINKRGAYETLEHGKTSIPGLYIAGDAVNIFSGLIGAAAEGYETGVALHHELVEEDWLT